VLDLRGITISTGGFAVRDIDLSVEPGACHVIIGPTGCGKTTLLETIAGLRRPDSGEIRLEGRLINDLPIEKRGISYLPQDLALFPHLTVEGNIFYGLRVQKEKDESLRVFAMELADNLDITNLLKRPIHNLSGGERQRVALVRALATGSRYLLLDEPLSALHEAMKKDLWLLITDIKARLGLGIVMVSHDMEEAFFLGDEISVMIDGVIHQTGPKDDVYGRPGDTDVAGFFGIKNLFPAEVIKRQGEGVSVRCPELNSEFIIPAGRFLNAPAISQGSSLTIGIRPENVMLIRPDLERHDRDNLLEGVISEIFPKGPSATVLFATKGSIRVIEIDVPDYAMKKLGVTKGARAIAVLRGEKIFTVGNL
jgi:ABC-type Fe3+/spermidine/putrescine transport system ATPase subunit